MPRWVGFAVALLAPFFVFAQDQSPRLPVKRVVLYKNGVGYFEHTGRVRGSESVAVSFTSGQLNDVLKSLTVLDLNGGRITGVEYGSSAPIDKQLGDLHLLPGDKPSLTEFLNGIRGARIEVRNGPAAVTGRLLSVERKTRISGGTTLEVDYISLITDAGELRTTEISPTFSVRLLERGLTGKVDRYLDLVSSTRQPDLRRLLISTEGTGDRSLFVSYISEVPVWKSTYRFILDDKPEKPAVLQGWAIVDNTVGQDWEGVELSLVAGAPQSFVQDLSQPLYTRRPVVPVSAAMTVTPQTHEATLMAGRGRLTGRVTDTTGAGIPGAAVKAYDATGNYLIQATTNQDGVYELTLPDGATRLEVESPGFQRVSIAGVSVTAGQTERRDIGLQVGSAAQAIEVTAAPSPVQAETAERAGARSLGSGRGLGGGVMYKAAPPPPPPPPPMRQFAPPAAAVAGAMLPAAVAQELGDLFEYKLKRPITIQRNRSALVPIVQASVAAEKVSIWNEQANLHRPQRALWVTNSSGLTLDGGSFSVIESDAFAGEGIFDPVRPGEKRLISYAMDLAVNASSKSTSEHQPVTRVRIAKGVITQESEVREKKTYTFRNEDTARRTVLVEHPVRPGCQLRGDLNPAESTAAYHRFRVPVDPKKSAVFTVEEVRPLSSTVMITNLDSKLVATFVAQKAIDSKTGDALRRVLEQKRIVAELEERKSNLEKESERIFDDQERLRENMKALKGSAEERSLIQRYTKQLNEQEDRLAALKKETEQAEKQHDEADAALDKMIEELSFEAKL